MTDPVRRRRLRPWVRLALSLSGVAVAAAGLALALAPQRPLLQQVSICGRTWTAPASKQLVVSFKAYQGCAGVTVTGVP